VKRISLLTAICLILMPSRAPAPIFGGFEDLNKLIDSAEFIVVAEMIKPSPREELDIGGGGTFEIEIVKVLKGDAKPTKRATAYLRDLFFTNGPRDIATLTHGFIPGQLYPLFLNKPGVHTRDEHGKPLPVDFEAENCEGDAVWISSSGGAPTSYFDLESLKGKSVRESVVALLKHTATERQKFATAVNAMIESGARNSLTQRITQLVWLGNNTEGAAKFYLSIFKHSSKDPNIDHYTEVGPDSKATFTGVRLWIDGQDIVLLNGGSKFKPTEATALTLNCDVQEEIDYYWEKLSAGGEKSRGGWLKDKFGVWWHVVPTDLPLLLGGKYGSPERVMNALLKMDKIDSAALRRAAWGEPEAEHK
jgi:predicted 3-demethylubiquinone-9 3-methyltransferase (glyoxalase superfamily)